ncbi:hypothetical protein H5T58_03140 [Candidatus Parcubacteria bacterium]|nr:hypothetical protein [Candidatus Parcubacteria bacterium]
MKWVLAQGFPSPINTTNFQEFLERLFQILIYFGFVAATFGIIYGGFILMTSEGDARKVEEGKKAIIFSVIGLGLLLVSYPLIRRVFP